jgi:hypothetical protein
MPSNNGDWLEDLPENCPPDDIEADYNGRFYRFVKTYPPTMEDFKSQRALYPDKVFKGNPPECQTRACSVYSGEKAYKSARERCPKFKKQYVIGFDFKPELGCCKQTGDNKGHYSWWLSANFDVNSLNFTKEV